MFNFIIYADDTTLFSTIKTFSDSVQNKSTELVINEELSGIPWYAALCIGLDALGTHSDI